MRRSFDSQVWGNVICSVADGTRPATNMGTVITPSATPNTYGDYAQVLAGASLTDDAYAIVININSVFQSANARDSLLTLGIDAAGGSSFTDFILHLSGAAATTYPGVGVEYYFPVFFKAGTSIGFKMAQNHATPATARVMVTLLTRPKIKVRSGSYVRTFGADTANSRGTMVTQGGASEGAWTLISTAAAIADRELWFWEFGVGCNNATMATAALHCDLGVGDGSNNKIVLANGFASTTSVESFQKCDANALGWGVGVANDNVYGRCQTSSSPDANFTMLAYGVGG